MMKDPVENPRHIVETADGQGRIEVVVHGLLKSLREIEQGLNTGSLLGRDLFGQDFYGFFQSGGGFEPLSDLLEELIEPSHVFRGLDERLMGEVNGTPVVVREEQEPHSFAIGLLQHLPNRHNIPERLGHLHPFIRHEPIMHKVLDKGFPCGCFRLSNFVFMMRENKIPAATVDIEGLTEVLRTHGRTLDMPSRSSLAPGTRPGGLSGLRGLPEGKVRDLPLVLVRLKARSSKEFFHTFMREPSVGFEF